MSDHPVWVEPDLYVRQPSTEWSGSAPSRGRLKGRRVLVVGGGQRVFDAGSDPIGNGPAMSVLFARKGAHAALSDINRGSVEEAAS